MSIESYKVCTGSFADDLAEGVKAAIGEGYMPVGGVAIMPDTDGTASYLAQALYRPPHPPFINEIVFYREDTADNKDGDSSRGVVRAVLPASGSMGDRMLIEATDGDFKIIRVEDVFAH